MKEHWENLRKLVDARAEDPLLWFRAETALEDRPAGFEGKMKIGIAIAKTLLGILAAPIFAVVIVLVALCFGPWRIAVALYDLGDEVCQYLRGWVEK